MITCFNALVDLLTGLSTGFLPDCRLPFLSFFVFIFVLLMKKPLLDETIHGYHQHHYSNYGSPTNLRILLDRFALFSCLAVGCFGCSRCLSNTLSARSIIGIAIHSSKAITIGHQSTNAKQAEIYIVVEIGTLASLQLDQDFEASIGCLCFRSYVQADCL